MGDVADTGSGAGSCGLRGHLLPQRELGQLTTVATVGSEVNPAFMGKSGHCLF